MFLAYGVNDSGELVYIQDVQRGRLAGVYCPYCGVGLIARKGRKVAHHFAHDGNTCNESQRDQDTISLPAYDRFNLELSPSEWQTLQDFHHGTGYYNLRQFNRLKSRGVIEYNEYIRQDQLTDLGKLPFGELTLSKFAAVQDEKIARKHDHLVWRIEHAQTEADHKIAVTDLRLYRAQLQRVLSATLYFLEIQHEGNTFYKIGVSTRGIDERIAEITQTLRTHLGAYPTITPLRLCAHQGAVELYFMHRYRDHQHPIGTHREYFTFEPRRNVLADLTRLGDRELTDQDRAILAGELSDVDPSLHKITVTTPDPVTVLVYDDRRMVYTRKVELKEYTFDCKQCGRRVTLYRYPGRPPTLCSPECEADYNRERDRVATRERVRRWRAKKRKRTS